MQQNAARRNRDASKSDGGVIPGLPGIKNGKIPLPDIPGIDKAVAAFSKLNGIARTASGGLGSVISAVKGIAPGAAAAVGAIKLVADGMVAMTKAGANAQANFEKINVALSTLSKNMGGSDDVSQLATQIQLLSAEGVGNLDQLTGAAKTLMVAFDGNTASVKKWLPIIDDVAVATGMSAEQFADLMARVRDTGEVEGRVFTTLQRQGIPVYEALAETLGVTGEEAKAAAKKGEIGMSEWMATVEKLHEKYKGLSAELSTNTLQGAIDTYTAMREMAFKGASEARNLQEIADKNARAAEYKLDAFDQVLQTNLAAAGDMVGRVGNFFDRAKDAFTPENIVASLQGFMSDITGTTDTIAHSLAASAVQFRQIPNFAGRSAKDIGQYLADAEKLYQQLDATLQNNSSISEETASDMRDAMELIRDRMRAAQEAADEATIRETQEAEKLAAAQRAAAAAAEEQARAAKKEAEERERNIKKMEEERLANIKDSEEYRQQLKENAAKKDLSAAAEAGTGTAFDAAAEKLAEAVSGLSLNDAIARFAELSEKIASDPIESITAEDKETHKKLEKMIDEIARLRATAEKNTERNNAEAERQARQARQTTETEAERASRQATEELQEFADALKQAGFSEEERGRRMYEKMSEMMEAAGEKLLHNLDVFNHNGDASVNADMAELIDALDAESAHAMLANQLSEKQIKEAVKQSNIARATLAAIEKWNLTPTAQ